MGKYKIALSDHAKGHLADWKKSGQLITIRKIEKIFKELNQRIIQIISIHHSAKLLNL